MRKWFVICGACSVLGYAVVYFALSGNPAPEEPVEQPIASANQPAEPVVLSQVVDVTDVDPLLDPLPGQPAGVPFDPTEPLEPAVPTTLPSAPMPHAID